MYNPQMVAERLKKLLLDSRITGKQMSSDLGIGVNTLSNIKRGDIKSVETFSLIADYLGCSVDYLIGRTDTPNETYQYSNSGNIVNGNNGNNSPLTINSTSNTDKSTRELVELVQSLPLIKKAEAIIYLNELKKEGK